MNKAIILIERYNIAKKYIALAESCTGGLLSDCLVQIPRTSQVLWGSFVCYTVRAKCTMLGLEEDFIQRHGTVSYEVACTMVQAVLTISSVDVALSTTGLAGPEGDDRGTPVGTVWIGIAQKGQKPDAQSFYCTGSRNEIRNTVVHCAIEILLQVLK